MVLETSNTSILKKKNKKKRTHYHRKKSGIINKALKHRGASFFFLHRLSSFCFSFPLFSLEQLFFCCCCCYCFPLPQTTFTCTARFLNRHEGRKVEIAAAEGEKGEDLLTCASHSGRHFRCLLCSFLLFLFVLVVSQWTLYIHVKTCQTVYFSSGILPPSPLFQWLLCLFFLISFLYIQ